MALFETQFRHLGADFVLAARKKLRDLANWTAVLEARTQVRNIRFRPGLVLIAVLRFVHNGLYGEAPPRHEFSCGALHSWNADSVSASKIPKGRNSPRSIRACGYLPLLTMF